MTHHNRIQDKIWRRFRFRFHCRIQTTRGFAATVAVMVLALGALAFELQTLSAASAYADSVDRREWRTQASFNLDACLDTLEIRAYRNYFISGAVSIQEFGCNAQVENNFAGMVVIYATSTFGLVNEEGKRVVGI